MQSSEIKNDNEVIQGDKLAALIFMALILSIVVFSLAGGIIFTRSEGVSAYFKAHKEYSAKMQGLMSINGIESLYRKDNSGPLGAGSYFKPTWLGAVVNGREIDYSS